MKTYGDIRLNSMLHLLSKILILLTLLTGSLQVFAAAPNSMVMGESDKAFGSGGHPYLLFSPERVSDLRSRLKDQEPGAVRFKLLIDRQVAGGSLGIPMWQGAVLYPITGDDKYCNYAVNEMELLVADDLSRIKSFADGGSFTVRAAYDSFLYVGTFLGGIGAVYDWCYGFLTPEHKQRWVAYGNEVLHNLWYYKEASWGGRAKPGNGYATNNPLNNYYYSFLEATMYFGLATQGDNLRADEWLTLFRDSKVENQMLPKFATIKGGGSPEGTGYGTALVRGFQVLDWWRDSTWKKLDGSVVAGERLYDRNSLARESLSYMLQAVLPTRTHIAPYGDHARDSQARLYDSHRAYMLFFSSLYPDSPAAKSAKTLLGLAGLSKMEKNYTAISDFMYSNNAVVAGPMESQPTHYYAESVGHIFTRTDWTKNASYFSASIGPYFEVHDHRDKNSFLFFKKEWLAFDQNINTHSGTNFREKYHNLVSFDNLDLDNTYMGMVWGAPKPIVHAVVDTPSYTYVSADTAPLYENRKTKVNLVEQYKRDMVYLKPDVLVVYDQLTTTTGKNIKKTWQLQSPFTPQYNPGSNAASFQGGVSSMKLTTLLPTNPGYTTYDYLAEGEAVRKYNGAAGSPTSGFRIDIPLLGEKVEFLNIIDLDNALSSAEITNQDTLSITVRLVYSDSSTQNVTISRCCGAVTVE